MDSQNLSLQDRLEAFLRDVKYRFPGGTLQKGEGIQLMVLNPIERGSDPEERLEFVRDFLHRAPELVKDYEDIVRTFGRNAVQRRQQLDSNQPQQLAFRPASNANANANANAGNANAIIPASTSLSPFLVAPAQQQLSSTEVGHSSGTQEFQDDSSRDDIQNLLALSEVNIPPHQRKQTPQQMLCALTEHQKIGLTWLLEQEKDRQKKGGLLADTMGLGKTVQAMALIVAHRSRDPKQKTTLIVAPLALLRQWEKEILTKIKPQHQLNTIVFHGEVAKYMSVSEMLTHDVVLCTYGKLQTEYKNKFEHKKLEKLRILSEKARFYRVILDEAHNIRNQTTYCSKAAANIQSTYRLCMTGTPFMNRAEEIFALIRFLNIPPYNEWERFSEDIIRPLRGWDGDVKERGMIKLQALFRSFTLRRTKDSRLDGKPIIKLPPRIDNPAFAEFNDEQREFYQALEVQQQLKFNKYLINGAVMKNYIHILILLLRLRQACDHPFLLKNLGIPEGTKLDEKGMIKLACQLPGDVVQKLKKQRRFECLLCSDAIDNPIIVHPCGHHICSSCFTASVSVVQTEEFGDGRADDDSISRKKSVVPCPGDNCKYAITPTNIVCYNFVTDVPDSASESDNDPFYDDRQQDDADADEYGDLDGFVVRDNAGEYGDGERSVIGDDSSHDSDSSSAEDSAYDAAGWLDSSGDKDSDDDDAQDGEVRDEDFEEALVGFQKTTMQRACEEALEGEGGDPLIALSNISPVQTDGAFDDINTKSKFRTPKRKPSAGVLDGHSGKKSRTFSGSPGGKKKEKAPKKKKMLTMADQRHAAQRSSMAMSRYKARLRKEWISSAKIDKIMEILEQIRPKKEKTLIFSLWTSFLDLVEIPVERANIKYTRYDGSMTPGAREAAVKSFMEDPTVRVMLVSLTAGNAGLNLTAASQVIVTEPFWNPYVEEQAIDRAHRFGQKKPVTVHRLLIEGTVEDRIVQLQEQKKMLVDAALSERGASNISRLNVAELRNLFGL